MVGFHGQPGKVKTGLQYTVLSLSLSLLLGEVGLSITNISIYYYSATTQLGPAHSKSGSAT